MLLPVERFKIPTPKDVPELSTTFRAVYVMIRDKWGYTARISHLLDMIKYSYRIEEWDIIDHTVLNNGPIDSKLMDFCIDFINSRPVEFNNVWELIKTEYQFSQREINLMESGNIVERLWAIFSLLANPNLDISYC